jgi:hypothetical protein
MKAVAIQTVSYQCSACERIYPIKEAAERCCVCSDCSKPLEHASTLCTPCRREGWARRILAEATVVPREEWGGPVVGEAPPGADFFAESFERYMDSTLPSERPPFVVVCRTVTIPDRWSAGTLYEDLVERVCDDLWDDARSHLDGEEELLEALGTWVEAQDVESWEPDYSRIILIRDEERRGPRR